ncbi:MAG: TIR domain-containing protein [Aeriscardovia sp.]|nr:TIR domain-containing protein [Aeriscardovia sp.]
MITLKTPHRWVDNQLDGTSVTVVLIGSETLNRPFVQYEICESIQRGNAVV